MLKPTSIMKYLHSSFFVVVILAFFTSCVPLKDSIYLQGDIVKELKDVEGAYEQIKSDYIVKPNDNLYIRVNSLDERTSGFLNNQAGYTQMPEGAIAQSLLGYRVDLDGSIEYPFVGKIYVTGLTLQQIREKIQLAISKYIDQSSVSVKLLNDNITVLGEVNIPGRYLLYSEELSLLEALSLAGDVTDFANKRKVRLIRKVEDVVQMIDVNTLDESIMFSQYYYLKPGDIIYVEPRRLKSWSLSTIPIGVTLTLVNTVLLFYTLSRTL